MEESPQAPFQQSQRYIVTRQSELSLLPTYTPGVSESYVDRWRLIVAPLSFSADRMQFSWRSPGIQTIMSSNVFLEFDVDVKVQGCAMGFFGFKARKLYKPLVIHMVGLITPRPNSRGLMLLARSRLVSPPLKSPLVTEMRLGKL